MKKRYWFLLSCLSVFFISCTGSSDNNGPENGPGTTGTSSIPSLSYSILSSVPHDTSSFTEGLEFYNNTLLESTGLNGKSKLLQLDPKTGKTLKQVVLDPKYFGEGITVLHDTVYQMTYQEHVVFVYDAKTFKKIKELPLKYEGWGLTNNGKELIASDGSSNLYYYEPGTFRLLRKTEIIENDSPVPNINELEWVDGFIYANQWQYNYILKINPSTSKVVAKMDLTDLVTKVRSDNHAEVLNGLAYNPADKKFYITGKNWPQLYEIMFDR